MPALTITPAQVAYVSGPKSGDQVAGEAMNAGAVVYYNAANGKWFKAQCDGTAAEAGQDGLGLALASADSAGARISIARSGSIVDLGAAAAAPGGRCLSSGRHARQPRADCRSRRDEQGLDRCARHRREQGARHRNHAGAVL
jgi:hypothetical protein